MGRRVAVMDALVYNDMQDVGWLVPVRIGQAVVGGVPTQTLMKPAVYSETSGPKVFPYEEVPDPVCLIP